MPPGSELLGGDLFADKRLLHRPSSGRWGKVSQSVPLWVFVSFHFTSSGSRLKAWPELGKNPYDIGANRQGDVVPWVEGIDSGFAEHPPRFVSVAGETNRWMLRPTSVTAAPVRQRNGRLLF